MSNYELLIARKEAGLTQQQVADLAGLTRDRYNRIELKKTEPTVEEAYGIAVVVKRDVSIFLSKNANQIRKTGTENN